MERLWLPRWRQYAGVEGRRRRRARLPVGANTLGLRVARCRHWARLRLERSWLPRWRQYAGIEDVVVGLGCQLAPIRWAEGSGSSLG